MANLLIGTGALTDALTPTTTDASAELPVTNVANVNPGVRWRTTDVAALTLSWDLGSSLTPNLAFLGYTNAIEATSVLVQGSDASDFSAILYNSGLVFPRASGLDEYGRTSLIHYIDPVQAARYWRYVVTPGAIPAGYFECGRAFFSTAWQPSENMKYGWDIRLRDPSHVSRSLGGSAFPNPRGQWRELGFRLENLGLAEMLDEALALDVAFGSRVDVLVVPDPSLSEKQLFQTSVYGLMRPLAAIKSQVLDLYMKPYRIVEWEFP